MLGVQSKEHPVVLRSCWLIFIYWQEDCRTLLSSKWLMKSGGKKKSHSDPFLSYNEAIEMAQNSYDYLWLSNAKEGLACTMILMAFLHADVGVSPQVFFCQRMNIILY
jgi:hypothetical protein